MVDSLIKALNIGVIGSDHLDLITFVATAFAVKDKKVAVIVEGENPGLESYFQKMSSIELIEEGESPIVTASHVDYIFGKKSEVQCQKYHVVISIYGICMNKLEEFIGNDWCFLITPVNKSSISKAKNQLDFIIEHHEVPEKMIVVYKDLVKSKIDKEYLDFTLGIDRVSPIAQYEFDYDPLDYKIDLLNQYNEIFSFKGISIEKRDFLRDLLEELMGYDKAEVKEIMKGLKRGK